VEATTALHAVELCKNIGVLDFILEGDVLTIIKAIEYSVSTRHIFGQIIDDIWVVLGSSRLWRVCHTKRGANSAAHGSAKEVIRCAGDRIWTKDKLPCIFHIESLKLFALSFDSSNLFIQNE
jgi:hypothetical protein